MQPKGINNPPFAAYMIADYYVIKARRFEFGWSQKDLAREAGICLTSVLKAERGKSISAHTNGAIRKALRLN